jgi:hypothetical protein
MNRPLKEDEPLSVTVKFRMTRSDFRLLQSMTHDNQLSPLLRELVRKEATRRGIR